MPVRNFTWADLPALLDFGEAARHWGPRNRELGRKTFQQGLGQPGLAPEANCLIAEEGGRLQGFCLVIPELPISRAVLDMEVAAPLPGGSQEREIVRRAASRARELGARVVHLCVPKESPRGRWLPEEGFSPVRTYWHMVRPPGELPQWTIPEGFTVRSFQPGDAAALAEVQNAAFGGSWGFSPNTVEQVEYRSAMANTSHQGILFLCHGQRTAGYCWTCIAPASNDSIRGVISMIGVVPDYRGQGISRTILLAGMEHLRSTGVADIGLQVDGSNSAAIRLYTSVGFGKASELQWFELDLTRTASPDR